MLSSLSTLWSCRGDTLFIPFPPQPICSGSDHRSRRSGVKKVSGFAKWSRNYGISLFAWISGKLRRRRSRQAAIRHDAGFGFSVLLTFHFLRSILGKFSGCPWYYRNTQVMPFGMNNISDRIWVYFGDLGARLKIFVPFYWHQVIWKAAHLTETARKEG